MPNSAVRTFSEVIDIIPMVSAVITTPVMTVTTFEVCRGRKPKIDNLFLPILVPSLSPINAIAPPVTTNTAIKYKPYIHSLLSI